MREDIIVPESTDVYVIHKRMERGKLFNNGIFSELKGTYRNSFNLATGYSDTHKSSTMRHGIGNIPAGEKEKLKW